MNDALSPPPSTDPRQTARAKLIAMRQSLPDRVERERVLGARVGRWLRTMPTKRVAFYWPLRGEPDLRSTLAAWLAEDAQRTAGLPVVVGKLLEFAPWTPGAPMKDGDFGISIPATAERFAPQVVLVPCVAIDLQRYRLGYGGGFYDRTLASLAVRPVTVGIAFDVARINSIGPQPHDVRLDLAITESGVL
jgi:5-formyltetrahydrofolate cyclo-ligase